MHEYMLQVTAYEREEKRDARGVVGYQWRQKRENDHLSSVERMQLVAAMAGGLLDPPRR